MNAKLNTHELTHVGSNIGIDTVILDEDHSKQFIKRMMDIFKPFRTTGHLSIGNETLTIPLEENEFPDFVRINMSIVLKDAELAIELLPKLFPDRDFSYHIGRMDYLRSRLR